MTKMASQITSLTVVCSTVYSHADQRKHQSSASLAFVWGIHRDRWISRTKGQLRGKCFHWMTSSCLNSIWRALAARNVWICSVLAERQVIGGLYAIITQLDFFYLTMITLKELNLRSHSWNVGLKNSDAATNLFANIVHQLITQWRLKFEPKHDGLHSSNCIRADCRFAPSQWETASLCNDVSHWLDASLNSALCSSIAWYRLHKIGLYGHPWVIKTTRGRYTPCTMHMIRASLQWRHNGRDSVSNHQPHECLLNCLFRRR